MFKQLLKITIILFFGYILAGCTVKSVVKPENAVKPLNDKNVIQKLSKHGDWFVIRGVHSTDNLVSTLTNMPFSHAAIYDKEKNLVIESDSNGVHVSTLDEFLGKSYRLLIIRPMWANESTSISAVENARDMISKKYNYTGLVGLDFPDSYYCAQVAIESYRPFIDKNLSTLNPIPKVISPGRMHHWGTIVYDTGP